MDRLSPRDHVTLTFKDLVLGLVGMVGLGLPLTVTVRVSRVSITASVRISIK